MNEALGGDPRSPEVPQREGELLFSAGQVWRSKKLADYRVKLVRPLANGVWIVEPSGSSAHGSYTINEDALRRADFYERCT